MPPASVASRVRAVLGPTNTGKTHRAIERMLSHQSGMIGLPLRLLAQEIYDRVVAQRGVDSVALITGEQKRIPANPRYFVCTTEAMPVDRPVAFLAVDEVQLAGSPNRGHIVTDRLLRARGVRETWFLGSDTIEPLLEELIPGVEIERHPRLSTLRGTGERSLASLPPRSAIVAFTAPDVYEIAERIRARHGGTSVVLGALSPRARNNQVAMYQSGEVRYLVATDAIGMGLNMDLDHVAFAALRKFDGSEVRALETAEIAQIAGRAGRYRRDGSFGTLKPLGPLDARINEDVENHRFSPLRRLFWRNSDLDFDSPAALLHTLEASPPRPFLVQVRDWGDHEALRGLLAIPELRRRVTRPKALRTLWEVCQIPDFRKTLTGAHLRLLTRIAAHLLEDGGQLPKLWVEERIARLDRVDGDIEALMTRIAWIRTWNYVSFRPDWVDDSRGLQERCQAIEDHLSDALHERLTERFVESRVQIVVDGLPTPAREHRAVPTAGGRIEGLRFLPKPEAPALRGPLRAEVIAELERRAQRLLESEDAALRLATDGAVLWEEAPVAYLRRGAAPRQPSLELPRSDLLDAGRSERLRVHLNAWLDRELIRQFSPLHRPAREQLSPPARGLVYALEQALGALPIAEVREQIAEIHPRDRRLLARLDLRVGVDFAYVAALFAPGPMATRAALHAAYSGTPAPTLPAEPLAPRAALSPGFARALGYRPLGPLWVRADAAESLAARLRGLARRPDRPPPRALIDELGGDPTALYAVAADLGIRLFSRPPTGKTAR